ncbi:hypothetical protein WA026_003524 [Henosepilachna vigintioctopunctata]|uniref:Multidrug resistance-associated protein lethal(2)03659 n=1 Tax=Henosepilachna vigintioctopunctata TaxID=420089 RepID=A0AAW1TP27_9CUCU
MNKTKYHRPNNNPYKNANIFKRLTFLYMFPIFFQTYRRGFTEENLFEAVDEHKSSILGDKIENLWYKEHKKSKKYALHKALFRLFGAKTIFTGIIKLIDEIALITIVPISIGKLVSFFEPGQTKLSQGDACIYAGMIGLTYLFVNLSFHPVMMTKMHISMKMRICCTSMIYRKALKLSKNALAKTTTGQIVNLLSNDVTKFEQGFDNTDYALVAPIQTILGLYILYREIGVSAVFGVLFLLSFVPLQIYVGKRTSSLRHKTAAKTDERVKLMNEIICGIQVIKMYCWEKPFSKLVSLARSKEMSVIRTHSCLMGILYSFEMFLTRTSIFISLLSYVLMGKYITAEKVFLVTSIYSTIRPCVTIMFALALSNLAEINVSLRRINTFLCLEELQDVDVNCREILEKDNGVIVNEPLLPNGNEMNKVSKVFQENDLIPMQTNKSINPSVILKDVSAKWVSDSADNTLEHINLNLCSNQLVAVIGPVGSGKSSLMGVILKELQIVKGSLDIKGIISYASQESWIFSGSVRDNILFGESYDKKRYAEVVRACSLKSDFLLFPFGDKSLVGERGSALSGGQKARINLARCVYKKADIYLLDDPLSAVDANVGKSLYQDCIQLFLHDKIRILVTHQIQYLKTADKIIILNNGQIEKIGRYEDLQDCDINFAELFTEPVEEDEKKVVKRRTSRQISVLQSIEEFEDEPEEVKENLTEGKIKMSTYYTYIRTGGSICMILLLLLSMLVARFFEYGGDFFLRTWVNMEQNPNSTYNATEIRTQIIYIYSGLTCGTIIFSMIYCLSLVLFFTKASINLHNSVVGKLIQGTMKFFDSNTSGRILNRFSKDMGILDEYIPFILYDVIAVFVVLCGTIFISVFVKPWLLLPCVVLITFLYVFRNFYIITSRNIKRVEGITRSPIYSHTNTTIYGLSTIRAFNAQNLLKEEFDAIQDKHSCAWFLFIASNRCFGYWLDIICVSFVMSVTYVLIFYSQNVYGGDVGLIFNQFVGLLISLQWGIRQWSELENQMTSVERIIEYTKIETEPQRTTHL